MVRSTSCVAVMAGAFACLAADGRALAADASRVCFSTGKVGGVIELGVAKGRLAAPGYGLLAGQTYGPDRHVACFGPKPLPVSGSYVTREDGSVVVSLTQIIIAGNDGCGRDVYNLLLRAPELRGTVCQGEVAGDSTGCGPARLVVCPKAP